MPAETKEKGADVQLKELMCDAVQAAVDHQLADLKEIREQIMLLPQFRTDLDKIATDFRAWMKRTIRDVDGSAPGYRGFWASREQAHRFGMVAMATLGFPFAQEYCKQNWELRALSTVEGATGALWIPEEFIPRLIDQQQEYGVARRNLAPAPMMTDVQLWPRATGALTVYCPAEGVAPTASDLAASLVTLTARDWFTLTYVPDRLDESSAVAIAELLGRAIARAFALQEDKCTFIGDGTSTYFRKVGCLNACGAAGVVSSPTGQDLYSEVGYNYWAEAIGRLPEYAGLDPRFYMHRSVFWSQLGKVNATTGELLLKETLLGGARTPTLLNVPVEITQVLPSTSTGSQASTKFAVAGDLRMAGLLGTRGGPQLAQDRSYKFAEGLLTVRGRQGVDIQLYNYGDASNVGAFTVLATGAAS